MARTLLLLFSLFLATLGMATTTVVELYVLFDKDKSVLTPASIFRLDSLMATLTLNGDHGFTVHGHTDSDGDQAYNDALSLARAEAVANYLAGKGADRRVITVDRYGERDPLASNRNEHGMALNRRVKVTFTRHYFADTEELRRALMEGSIQRFTIDPTKEQTIVGAAGVQVRFEAGSFIDAHGRAVQGAVQVEMTEAVGLQAMLAHQLSTRSGERMLETGGMLRVQATDENGNALRLAAASPMNVAVPMQQNKPGMELFLSSDGTDWNATAQPLKTVTVSTWREPRYPTPPHLSYNLPVYVENIKGRPVKPVEPVKPREPVAPRRESYTAYSPWWTFLAPKRVEAKNEMRYAAALERHAAQMHKYERKVATYEAECSSFPERLLRYNERMAAWQEQKAAEYAVWYADVYSPMLDRYNAMYAPQRARYDSLVANWSKVRAESLRQYTLRADSMGTADMGGLNAYVFSTAQLGWINCDRFINLPGSQKYQVITKGQAPKQTEAFVVFTGIRSILRMGENGWGELASPPVARNEPAVLFAYTVIDGRAHVCRKPISPNERPALEFEASSFAEIGQLLKELGQRPA
ncbi:MAG: OmpA family protein [Flavobacteriales bacterium]|nr:OmpA family protein [Flavobacteriales bacterium]